MRLDKHLQQKFPEYSRSKVGDFIRDGKVLVNGLRVKPGYLVKAGDKFEFNFDSRAEFEPAAFDLEILYEDSSCFVLNKPSGLVVHPGEGGKNLSGTLANALLSKVGKNFAGSMRPGIVHRLDKDTSGLMVVAKTQEAYDDLVAQFKKRAVKKMYYALIVGKLASEKGIIESSIARSTRDRKRMAVVSHGGREAMSIYQMKDLFRYGDCFLSLVMVEIKSGRTHQIRVHFSSIRHPVLGDSLYGSRKMNKLFQNKLGLDRQFLHAYQLKFRSPETNKEIIVKSKLPKDLASVIENLKSFKI